jgi:hypothetical protein
VMHGVFTEFANGKAVDPMKYIGLDTKP